MNWVCFEKVSNGRVCMGLTCGAVNGGVSTT